MLFRRKVLERIVRGEITIAFRRWRRPTVRSGGRLRTPVGELAIERVVMTSPEAIVDADARAAGFADRAEALSALRAGDGRLYRIEFRLARDDPRQGLARSDDLDAQTAAAVRETLRRLDDRSHGPDWTFPYLVLVSEHPGAAAAELAGLLGVGKAELKRRMRKLRELGLTESLEIGYRLSPRGAAFLGWLAASERHA
jgi:DNA-binding transcriptional ArsR family regulator